MIVVHTHGFDRAVLQINEFAEFDRRALLAALAETVRKQTIRRFATKTAPGGGKWAPLKPSSVRGRRTPRDILVDTGRLRNSIASKVYGHTAEIGTNVFYGKFHQFGTKKMVARPFLGIDSSDVAELRRVAEAFIRAATVA
jgi:phage virion morphogenesis protein